MKRTYFNIILALCVGTQLQAMNNQTQRNLILRDIGTQTGFVGLASILNQNYPVQNIYRKAVEGEKNSCNEVAIQTDPVMTVVDKKAGSLIQKRSLLSKCMPSIATLKNIAIAAGCAGMVYRYWPCIVDGAFRDIGYDLLKLGFDYGSSIYPMYITYTFMSASYSDYYNAIINDKGTIGDDYGFKKVVGGVPQDIRQLAERLNGDSQVKKLYGAYEIDFPKGILFYGKPGTGKTFLARAIAEEINCPFIPMVASNFITTWNGTGPNNVNTVFNVAKAAAKVNDAKTIIFIDELDAIGSRRKEGLSDDARKALAALLTQMSGFGEDPSVIVIGATNDPNALDPALIRAGRFDKIIKIELPNKEKRIALLDHYTKNRPVADDVSFDTIADDLEGCSAADIKELVNVAAVQALENSRSLSNKSFVKSINQSDFIAAVESYKKKHAVWNNDQTFL